MHEVDPKEKEDESITLENPLQNLYSPQKVEFNIFVPLNDPLEEPIETLRNETSIPNIQEETTKSSRMNENLEDSKLVKNEKSKRKYSEKSENYHRVQNTRKIKTKKVTKDHLQRSEYFYVDTIDEAGDNGPIMNLLNEYEAFQQSIFNAYFEKKIIKLSHYGNKNHSKKKSSPEISHINNFEISNKFERSKSFKESYFNMSKSFSRSFAENNLTQIFSRSEAVEDKCRESRALNGNGEKRSQYSNKISTDINKKLMPPINLSKHTTPIRTIFLNQTEKSTNNQNLSIQQSPNHISSFTPLISERASKKPSLKPFKSILENPIFNNSHEEYRKKSFQDISSNIGIKKSEEKPVNRNTLGISIQQKKELNFLPIDYLKQDVKKNGNEIEEMILAEQITLPQYRKKSNNNFSELQRFNLTIASNQSYSRSRSKKGLSVTQSTSSLKTKNSLNKTFSKSITKLMPPKEKKNNDVFDRKLNLNYANVPKRVIKIY